MTNIDQHALILAFLSGPAGRTRSRRQDRCPTPDQRGQPCVRVPAYWTGVDHAALQFLHPARLHSSIGYHSPNQLESMLRCLIYPSIEAQKFEEISMPTRRKPAATT